MHGVPSTLSICVERPLLECQNIPVLGLEGRLLGRIKRDEEREVGMTCYVCHLLYSDFNLCA